MRMLTTRPKKTVDDYMSLPDEVRCELFDGEFYRCPSPGFGHQKAIGELFIRLKTFVSGQALGEVVLSPFDCVFSIHNVAQPDIVFIASENLGRIRERLQGPPELAVEVLSRFHEERDRIVKRDLYAKFGVREFWIVDPEVRTIEVFVGEGRTFRGAGVFGSEDVLQSPLLPGLDLRVGEVFR